VNTCCPAVPANVTEPSWPGLLMVTDPAVPPTVVVAVASAGITDTWAEKVPVSFNRAPSTSMTSVYVPVEGSCAVMNVSAPSSWATGLPSGPSSWLLHPHSDDHCRYTCCPAVPVKVHRGRWPATVTPIGTAAPPTVMAAVGSATPVAVTWNEPVSPLTGTRTISYVPAGAASGRYHVCGLSIRPPSWSETSRRPPGP
jgi:hypothetical protein